jgi:hypothetical protein
MRNSSGINLILKSEKKFYKPPLKRLEGGMTKVSGEEGVVLLAGGIHTQLREIIHVCLHSQHRFILSTSQSLIET